MPYSFWTGVWKAIKNGVIVLGPAGAAAILEFFRLLPPDISTKYALWVGFITYFIKNYLENRKLE